MQIVINHLTRMSRGHICVAGIEPQTGRHVRPVTLHPLLPSRLRSAGGPFDVAVEVDLGWTRWCGSPPAMEDHRVNIFNVKWLRDVPPDEFWEINERVAVDSPAEIFGPGAVHTEAGRVWYAAGTGLNSLGVWRPAVPPQIVVRSRTQRPDEVRLLVEADNRRLDLPITDLRLYWPDGHTPNRRAVAALQRRFADGEAYLLAVGLTRPYAPQPDHPAVHWMQINNIHFRNLLGWRIATANAAHMQP